MGGSNIPIHFLKQSSWSSHYYKKNSSFNHISTVTDPNGRFLIVTGYLYSMHVTIVNIYGPNLDDPGFFRKIFNKLTDLSNTNLIVAGDYNLVMDVHLDRSSSRDCAPSNASTMLKCIMSSSDIL